MAEKEVQAICTADISLFVPSYNQEDGSYHFVVNYYESIAKKISFSREVHIVRESASSYITDKRFPDDRTGVSIVSGHTLKFGEMTQGDIEVWAMENNKKLARPKELIDFSRSFPGLKSLGSRPVIASGQFWRNTSGDRHCFCLDWYQGMRALETYSLGESESWPWVRFLLIDM
jgi:hypothetical protein